MAFLDFLLVLATVAYGGIGTYFLVLNPSQYRRLYGIFVYGIGLWALFVVGFRFMADPALLTGILRGAYVATLLIALSAVYFANNFPTRRSLTLFQHAVIVAPPAVASLYIALSDSIASSLTLEWYGWSATSSNLTLIAFFSIFATYFYGAWFLLWRNARNCNAIVRMQARYMIIGVIFSSLLGIVFNFIIPFIGSYQYITLGPLLSFGVIIFITYTISHKRLFNLQLKVQQATNIILPVFIAILATVPIALYASQELISEHLYVGPVIIALGIIVYIVISELLRRSRWQHVFSHNVHQYRNSLKKLADDALAIIDLNVLLERVMQALVDDMRVNGIAILMNRSDSEEDVFDIVTKNNYIDAQLLPLTKPNDVVLKALHSDRGSYIAEEIEFELQSDISPSQKAELHAVQELLKEMDITILLTLRVQQNVIGCIALGKKMNGRIYTAEDIELLEQVSEQLAIAFVNSQLHSETEHRAEMLQKEVEHAVDAWKQKSHENEELSMLRSQFISVMSHQLRTPISVIRNSLELVLKDYLSIAEQEDTHMSSEQLRHIMRLLNNAFLASDNLKNTSESILASSEFIGSVPGLQIKRINTKEFFERCINRVQRILNAKSEQDITLNIEMPEMLPSMFVSDEKKLGLVIDNLLANAALYTTRGSITFAVRVDDGEFLITVSDTGIGIPASEQDKVFQRFMRLDNAQRVVPDGSGLGLYLAKSYIDLLRGSIEFDSTEDVGTTFTIHIPLEYRYIAT